MKKLTYQQRFFERNVAIVQLLREGRKPAEVTELVGVCRATVYNVQRRLKAQGLAGLRPQSKRPKHPRNVFSVQLREQIVALRRRLGYGADKIQAILQADPAVEESVPCARTIHTMLAVAGLLEPAKRRRRPFRDSASDFYQTRRPEAPNHIVELDIKQGHWLAPGQPVTVIAIKDLFSKVAVARLCEHATSQEVGWAILDYIERFGAPQRLKSDNDMRFLGQLASGNPGLITRLLFALGIRQVLVPPGSPRWNANIERFLRTWDDECWSREHWEDWEHLRQGHARFLERYLVERPHDTLRRQQTLWGFTRPMPLAVFQQALPAEKVNRPAEQLLRRLRRQLQEKRIGLRNGALEFVRRVKHQGVHFKGQHYQLPQAFEGKHVRALIDVRSREQYWNVRFFYRDLEISKNRYDPKAHASDAW